MSEEDVVLPYRIHYKENAPVCKKPVMVSLTTQCPTCKKEWTRDVYEECLIMGLALEMCGDCDQGELITLVGNNRVWKESTIGAEARAKMEAEEKARGLIDPDALRRAEDWSLLNGRVVGAEGNLDA